MSGPAYRVDPNAPEPVCTQPGYESPDGWICTAQEDHSGNHVAYKPDGTPYATWPQDAITQRRPVVSSKRHPAEVTSDRLADHYERWHHRLTGEERDALSLVRNALERIAEEGRHS